MQTRKLTEVPLSEFSKETNFIVEIDEEMKRVRSSDIRQLVTDEETRAKAAEKKLGDDLAAEALRASTAENTIADSLTAEISRASGAEENLAADLAAEVTRAVGAEEVLADNLAAEVTRATSAEKAVAADLEAETARAETAEKQLADNLSKEVARAEGAEKLLADDLAAETSRAKAAEKTVSDNLTAEVNRAKFREDEIDARLTEEQERAGSVEKGLATEINNEAERAMESETDLLGSIQAEMARATAVEGMIQNTIATNTPKWNDKYTKNEIDNKFSTLESNTDWKEAVATYDDIATTYPVPQDGWTVNVKDTDYTYRWSGEKWVAISANAIPKATQSVDGLFSKEDKAAFDDAYSKRHTHTNKSVLDKITQTLLDNWSAAYSHISDAIKHITPTERTNWNDANSKKHSHGNKTVIDKITQALLDNWSAAYSHISNKSNPHGVTAAQAGAAPASHTHSYLPLSGGTVTGNVTFNTSLTGLDWNMNTDYAKAYFKNTGDGDTDSYFAFETGDNGNEYFRWLQKSGSTTTELMNLKSDGLRVKGKKVAVEGHTHTKSQITDMPTKVSQFTNDSGYITQADIDTSQNHTHANKTVLDKITQALLDTWNGKAGTSVATQTANGLMAAADKKKLDGVAAGANNYVHPTTAGNKHIPAGGSSGQFLKWSANGTAVWAADNNTTYPTFKAATSSTAGGTGLVPAPAAGAQAKYLRADGTWQTPPNTAYSHPNSGVTAGTYRSVAVNAQGHVTAGLNPTTLAGYGITDAAFSNHNHDNRYYTKADIDNKILSNSFTVHNTGSFLTEFILESRYNPGFYNFMICFPNASTDGGNTWENEIKYVGNLVLTKAIPDAQDRQSICTAYWIDRGDIYKTLVGEVRISMDKTTTLFFGAGLSYNGVEQTVVSNVAPMARYPEDIYIRLTGMSFWQ